MNRFLLIGVNHKTAPVEVRERLAIPESRLPEATKRLAGHAGIEEAMIVSTCNRVELLARAQNGTADLRSFIREYFQVEPCTVEQHLYEYREREAVRHLFRVTSSLDSMVVGEPQILGQVKQAYAVARGVGAINSHLDALVTRAFAVAKRVRSETAIGTSAVSVASVAVELAQKIFGSLEGRAVYLIGAGKMSELAARHLLAHGAGSIFVANRTYEKALEMAERFHGNAIHFDKLYETADKADIVITSTGAPHAIFRREHGERFLARRKNRPMFFIDIAVPRNIDPAMNELDSIFVYDIDDLQQVRRRTWPTARRRRSAPSRSSTSRSSASPPACRPATWCPPSSPCRDTWRTYARRKSSACAGASARPRPSRMRPSRRLPAASSTRSCTLPSPR